MVYKRTACFITTVYGMRDLFILASSDGSYLGLFDVSIFAFRLPQRVAIDQEQGAICKDDRDCIMLAILYSVLRTVRWIDDL